MTGIAHGLACAVVKKLGYQWREEKQIQRPMVSGLYLVTRPKIIMHKLLQLVLALVMSGGIAFYQWYNTPFYPLNGQAFTIDEMRKFYEADKQQQRDLRNARVARRVFARYSCGQKELPILVGRNIRNTPLSPAVVAATIVVESSCNPSAISPAGAVGLLQVMPKVWGVPRKELLNPARNIEVGTRILSDYVKQSGLRDGLKRYYGMFDGSDAYADRILMIAGAR